MGKGIDFKLIELIFFFLKFEFSLFCRMRLSPRHFQWKKNHVMFLYFIVRKVEICRELLKVCVVGKEHINDKTQFANYP